jgi:hypothetical protein
VAPLVQNMRVDHGRADVLVAQKLLDRSESGEFESPIRGTERFLPVN